MLSLFKHTPIQSFFSHTHLFVSLSLYLYCCSGSVHLSFFNYICFTYFLHWSSSPRATSMTITGIVWGAVSGAIQTTAQILGCRPHVEERGLQALPTRRTLPQHNAPFHRVPPEASHKPTMRLSQRLSQGMHTHAHTHPHTHIILFH